MIFFALGAPFAGALEVIAYAGAIMVLFVFVVMMLNLGAGFGRPGAGLAQARYLGGASDSGRPAAAGAAVRAVRLAKRRGHQRYHRQP
jgi:NADH dehydrogenase subunit J (EC 1.6.5.3)